MIKYRLADLQLIPDILDVGDVVVTHDGVEMTLLENHEMGPRLRSTTVEGVIVEFWSSWWQVVHRMQGYGIYGLKEGKIATAEGLV